MVKLKTRMVRTDNLEELERDREYGRIVQTRFGGYELQLPTKLNEEVKRFMGSKDFDMDVVKEGEDSLRVILTPRNHKKRTVKMTKI